MGLVHAFVSVKPPAPDPTIVDGPKWNDTHRFTGANLGALLYRDAADLIQGLGSATGVLRCTAPGAVPFWDPTIDTTELGYLDGVTPGVVTASKAVVVDANKDIASFRNLTASGILATPVINGVADVIAMRNGTATQTFRVGPAGSSVYLRKINALNASLYVEDAQALNIGTGDAARWQFSPTGHFLALGAFNIGDGLGNSPVNIWAESSVITGATGTFFFGNGAGLTGVVDGAFVLRSQDGTKGVGVNILTDGTLLIRNRAHSADANLSAAIVTGSTALVVAPIPASAGAIRLPNATAINWRNAANTADWGITFGATLSFMGYLIIDPATGNTYPGTDANYSLGLSNRRFTNGFFSGTITMGGFTIPTTGGTEVNFTGASAANITAEGPISLTAGTLGFISLNVTGPGEIARLTGGGLIFPTDNTYDIGATGATRPRTGYFGTAVVAGEGVFPNAVTISTGYLAIGTTPAAAGAIRLADSANVSWRTTGSDYVAMRSVAGAVSFSGGTLYPTSYTFYTGSSTGLVVTSGLVTVANASIAVAATPATLGAIRLENDANLGKGNITWRNGANTNNIALRLTASDVIDFSGGGVYPSGFDFRTAGGSVSVVGGTIALGANPATTGAIRLANAAGIYARNAANTVDHHLIGFGSGNEVIIAGTNSGVVIPGGANRTFGNAVNPWTNIYATNYGSANLTGTLVTNDAQAVANDAVISLGTNAVDGLLIVINTTEGREGLFLLSGTRNATTKIADNGVAGWGTVAGTAAQVNVYWSAANSRYELENKRGGTIAIRLVRVGV